MAAGGFSSWFSNVLGSFKNGLHSLELRVDWSPVHASFSVCMHFEKRARSHKCCAPTYRPQSTETSRSYLPVKIYENFQQGVRSMPKQLYSFLSTEAFKRALDPIIWAVNANAEIRSLIFAGKIYRQVIARKSILWLDNSTTREMKLAIKGSCHIRSRSLRLAETDVSEIKIHSWSWRQAIVHTIVMTVKVSSFKNSNSIIKSMTIGLPIIMSTMEALCVIHVYAEHWSDIFCSNIIDCCVSAILHICMSSLNCWYSWCNFFDISKNIKIPSRLLQTTGVLLLSILKLLKPYCC